MTQMKKINVEVWNEVQKDDFWEEWCSIGAYCDDSASETPWGMPWTYCEYIEVKASDQTMRDFARTYWASVRDEIQQQIDEMEEEIASDYFIME